MPARHRSRQRALQILFQWDLAKQPVEKAIASFYETLYSEENKERPAPDTFMEALATGTSVMAVRIDAKIEEKADNWRLERMAVVDRNILRLAVYELLQKTIPPAVVIDEALELARKFSNDESVSFINGILDAINKGMA